MDHVARGVERLGALRLAPEAELPVGVVGEDHESVVLGEPHELGAGLRRQGAL